MTLSTLLSKEIWEQITGKLPVPIIDSRIILLNTTLETPPSRVQIHHIKQSTYLTGRIHPVVLPYIFRSILDKVGKGAGIQIGDHDGKLKYMPLMDWSFFLGVYSRSFLLWRWNCGSMSDSCSRARLPNSP